MARKAQRTLVKSPPEVWQLIDDEDRALPWLRELGAAAEIEAIERRPEELVVWRAGEGVRLGFEIAEKGLGHARHDRRRRRR